MRGILSQHNDVLSKINGQQPAESAFLTPLTMLLSANITQNPPSIEHYKEFQHD
jgi:hypothetical protein